VKFDFVFSPVAVECLDAMRKFDQKRIRDAMADQLSSQPTVETRNRKRLRPNQLAEWELRVGTHRVFYDVDDDESLVRVVAIGYKQGNKLFILDEEYEL
jgi:mRNA-degrading endonuclease RelE of RelBE toxin-antitoxin system